MILHPAPFNETEHIITVSRAARLLDLSESMVRLLSNSGRLPCKRIGTWRLFNVADVMNLRAARAEATR